VMMGKNPKSVLGINGNKDRAADPQDVEFVKGSLAVMKNLWLLMRNPMATRESPGPDYPTFENVTLKTFKKTNDFFDVLVKKIGVTQDVEPYFVRLLQRGEITEQEAKNELGGLIIAGVDTTHAILLWLMLNLGKNLEKQEKLREELVRELGDGPLEEKHLKSLPYLNQVFRENYRISFPSPLLTYRRLPDDAEIGGYMIPKETKLGFCPAAIQMDPNLVDNPQEFLPERWSPEEVKKRQGTAKQVIDHLLLAKPFGFGQRMCIGARLAEVELKAVLCRIVRDYRFEWYPNKQDYKTVFNTFAQAEPFPTMAFTKCK